MPSPEEGPARSALLIGCGNIGAGYDLASDEVLTHAKALSRLGIPFDVADIDPARAAKIASIYGGLPLSEVDSAALALPLSEVDSDALAGRDLVCIASSTATHAPLLLRCFQAGVGRVLLEKPIATSVADLQAMRAAFEGGRGAVVVNYIRRFAPGYVRLRERLAARPGGPLAGLGGVVVRYQRGFLNNGSHALDLLSFLLGVPVAFDEPRVLRSEADAFADDPTLSLAFAWQGAPVMMIGLIGSSYPIFEIELDYRDTRVKLLDRGNVIEWWGLGAAQGSLLRDPGASETNVLRDYMLPVMRHTLALSPGGADRGNFLSAWETNSAMLNLLERMQGAR